MAQGITDPAIDPTDPTLTQPLLGGSAPGGTDDIGAQIDALYQSAGISDAGRGGGFADKAYWREHPSEVTNGRLAADLAGTGTDQPTGTPGRGPWLNSGRNAPEASIGQPTRTANGGFWTGSAVAAPPAVASDGSPAPDPTGLSSVPYDPTTGNTAPIDPTTGAPQSDVYPGWHWDSTLFRYMRDEAPGASAGVPPPPTGLNGLTADETLQVSRLAQQQSAPGTKLSPAVQAAQRQALVNYLLAQHTKPAAPTVPPPVTTGGGGGGQTPVDPNDPNTVLP